MFTLRSHIGWWMEYIQTGQYSLKQFHNLMEINSNCMQIFKKEGRKMWNIPYVFCKKIINDSKPITFLGVQNMTSVIKCCIILHNMVVEKKRGNAPYNEIAKNLLDEIGLGDDEQWVMEYFCCFSVEDSHQHHPKTCNIHGYINTAKQVHSKETHSLLKQNLVEHLWNAFG